ncbi:MAG: hypothetical protein ACK4P4_08485 [Allorhizobium sp.]
MQELEFRSTIAGSTAVQRELARLIIDIFQVDVSPLDRLEHDPSIVSLGWWCGDELVAAFRYSDVAIYGRRKTSWGSYDCPPGGQITPQDLLN